MKLLRKAEVTALKEREKAREAAEGLRIAQKVDALRELQVSEAKKLDDFRVQSLRATTEDMKILGEQRDSLAAEVSSLEKKLNAMLPGMGTKREELDRKEKELLSLDKSLKEKKESIDVLEIDVIEAKKDLRDSLQRVRSREDEVAIKMRSAEENDTRSFRALASAKDIEATAIREKQERELVLSQREAIISEKEREMEGKEKELQQREGILQQEKVKLEDRRKMVERTIERLRQQRINVG